MAEPDLRLDLAQVSRVFHGRKVKKIHQGNPWSTKYMFYFSFFIFNQGVIALAQTNCPKDDMVVYISSIRKQ